MRRLRYGHAVSRDFIAIARFIRDSSGSRQIATSFSAALRRQCERLAELPGALGRPRPELRRDMRSFAFKGYVIFFRYDGDTVEIVRVLERHRDIAGHFGDDTD